jgi:hypothetical protein
VVDVVVVRELDQAGAEVSLVDDDQMIKALSADRAIEPLGDRIRARGPERGSDAGDAQSEWSGSEVAPLNGVAVMNEVVGGQR